MQCFFEIFLRLWYFVMDFFSLNNYFSNRRKKSDWFANNFNYYATQSGRSRDPYLGRDQLFAGPCSRSLLIERSLINCLEQSVGLLKK